MHTFIKAVALYASLMTVISALSFVAYLEVYSLITKDVLSSADYLSWRSLIPKFSMWMMVFGGIISACATLATIAGF